MICDPADVTDSKCNGLFIFLSTVTEKVENFQRRGKSYLQSISEFEALPQRDGCDISSATPNRPSSHSMRWLHHCWVFSHLLLSSLFESWLLAWVCFICSVNLSAGACPIFVTSTECEISLVHHLAVGMRCDDVWRLSADHVMNSPGLLSPSAFCILQVIKNWRCRSPGNKAHCFTHTNHMQHTTPTL